MFYMNCVLTTVVSVLHIAIHSSTVRPQYKRSKKHTYFFPHSTLCNTLETEVYQTQIYADVQLQSVLRFEKLHFYVVPISPYEGIICYLSLPCAGPQYRQPQWHMLVGTRQEH